MLKETFDMVATATVIVGGGIAAFHAIHEMQQARRQRGEELRWRRAGAAREMLKEIHEHPHACAAVTMMDWSGGAHDYDTGDGTTVRVSYEDVLATLAKPPAECRDAKQALIRDSFDWLFYYVDRIEHAIRTSYVGFEDVESVFLPYARRVNAERAVYETFLDERQYALAKAFFRRYPAAQPPPGGESVKVGVSIAAR